MSETSVHLQYSSDQQMRSEQPSPPPLQTVSSSSPYVDSSEDVAAALDEIRVRTPDQHTKLELEKCLHQFFSSKGMCGDYWIIDTKPSSGAFASEQPLSSDPLSTPTVKSETNSDTILSSDHQSAPHIPWALTATELSASNSSVAPPLVGAAVSGHQPDSSNQLPQPPSLPAEEGQLGMPDLAIDAGLPGGMLWGGEPKFVSDFLSLSIGSDFPLPPDPSNARPTDAMMQMDNWGLPSLASNGLLMPLPSDSASPSPTTSVSAPDPLASSPAASSSPFPSCPSFSLVTDAFPIPTMIPSRSKRHKRTSAPVSLTPTPSFTAPLRAPPHRELYRADDVEGSQAELGGPNGPYTLLADGVSINYKTHRGKPDQGVKKIRPSRLFVIQIIFDEPESRVVKKLFPSLNPKYRPVLLSVGMNDGDKPLEWSSSGATVSIGSGSGEYTFHLPGQRRARLGNRGELNQISADGKLSFYRLYIGFRAENGKKYAVPFRACPEAR